MRVNLIEQKKSALEINWVRVIITIIFAATIMGLIFNYLLIQKNKIALRREINAVNRELEIYLPRQEEYYSLQEKIKELKKKPQKEIPEYRWGPPLRQLGFIIPGRAMFNSVEINGNKIIFSGTAHRAEDLRELKQNIISSRLFNSVDLYKLVKEEEIDFQIQASLSQRGD